MRWACRSPTSTGTSGTGSCNKAFLDWLGKTDNEILGREVIEVLGRDVYQLYRAYIDAALSGERTTYERQLVTAGRAPLSGSASTTTRTAARRATSAASSSRTATSIT